MVVLDRFSRAVQGLDVRHGSVGKRESVVVRLHNRCGGKLHEMAPTLQPVTVTVSLLEEGEGDKVRPIVAVAAFVKPRKANGIFHFRSAIINIFRQNHQVFIESSVKK